MIAILYIPEEYELFESSMSDRFDFQTVIEDPMTKCNWCGTTESQEWKHVKLRFGQTDCYCSDNCTLAGNVELHMMWARICIFIGIMFLFIDVVFLFQRNYILISNIIMFSLLLIIFVALRNASKRGMAIRKEIPEGSKERWELNSKVIVWEWRSSPLL